jgi:peptide/nickel transport system substrate-binding protein
MIDRRTFLRAMAATTSAAASVSAGLAPAFAQQPKTGGTLVYAAGVDAQTLDPQFITDIPTFRIAGAIFEALTSQDDQGKIGPGLATSWSLSDDKRTWTFKLRPNVKFHDGTAFDAAAVKSTYDRILDPATGSPRRSTLAAVEAMTVVDDLTFRITTKQPFAPLLAQLSAYNVYILSPTQVQKEGADFKRAPAGTGPFKFKSWQPGEKLTLVRNDNYWGEKPKLDAVEFRVVPEDSARTLLLLSGQADVISGVPTVLVKRMESNDKVRMIRKTGYRTIYLGMNLAVKPFEDVRVRHAIAHAINKQALLQGVLSGIGTLGGSYESSVIDGSDKSLQPYPYDVARAKKLLADAGFPNGFTTDFFVPTGLYTMDRQLGEAIQSQLAAVGIKANIQAPEISTFLNTLSQAKAPMFIGGKGSPTGDMDFTQTLSNGSTGRMNHFNFKNPDVDKLIEQQRVAVDPQDRSKVLNDLQGLVYREAPHITLYYEDQLWATRSNVNDVRVYVNEFVNFSTAWKA